MNTITKNKEKEQIENLLNNPCILILENDDYNTFEWVIECLIKICNHDPEQASQCAHLVHLTGRCDVKRGDKETITKMHNKLKKCGLLTTVESS